MAITSCEDTCNCPSAATSCRNCALGTACWGSVRVRKEGPISNWMPGWLIRAGEISASPVMTRVLLRVLTITRACSWGRSMPTSMTSPMNSTGLFS